MLLHGTSADSALKILQTNKILPSEDNYFYCFDGSRPESMAGALCFATGDGVRNGSIKEKNLFSKYVKLNPDFPKGVKGAFIKVALKKIANMWAKDQVKNSESDLAKFPAIIVFKPFQQVRHVSRQGFINETLIHRKDIPGLEIEKVYIDATLLETDEVGELKGKGYRFEDISECLSQVIKAVPSKKGPRL